MRGHGPKIKCPWVGLEGNPEGRGYDCRVIVVVAIHVRIDAYAANRVAKGEFRFCAGIRKAFDRQLLVRTHIGDGFKNPSGNHVAMPIQFPHFRTGRPHLPPRQGF